MTDDELNRLIENRCLCCRRELHGNNISGYCKRTACRRMRYQNDADYREKKLKSNSTWYFKNADVLKDRRQRRKKVT